MKILFLDTSGNTGFCVGDSRARPRFGVAKLPQTGNDVGRYLAYYDRWLRDLVANEQPEVIGFEAPILPFQKSHVKVVRKLMSLAGVTEMIAHQSQIKCYEITIQQIKQFLAGHGFATKDAMIRAAIMFGFDVGADDNMADAVGGWGFTVQWLVPRDAAASGIFSMGHLGASAARAR